MAITEFQLIDNQTFLPGDISNGIIYESPDQLNGTGLDLSTGIRVIVDYHDLQSIIPAARLQAVVEGKSEQGQFYTIAYQFEEFGIVGIQQRRQIVMAPELAVLDPGIDNIVFIGNDTVEQISTQQGILPDLWRIRIGINDLSGNFVSVRLSLYGQRFNQPVLPEDFRGILTDTAGDRITDGGNLVVTGVS